ncbi:hypothetical protein N4T20_02160 [Flavobacterium sp. TR2]|uniref:hypothetical protein n=1 Tax=Flavobacterium sp. TR2 TaxID=2977321 RepID=UPI0021B10F20|nr:hypothetical protein [Flavobacterium sp. TR2]UWY28738.1 hypothetical protein N4T20_02160 [Flavobacterium sp. TR2]
MKSKKLQNQKTLEFWNFVGDDSLFRFFIGRFEPPTTSDEKSECSELAGAKLYFGMFKKLKS